MSDVRDDGDYGRTAYGGDPRDQADWDARLTEPTFRVDPDYILVQRAYGWPDFHPEDFCHRCGARNCHSWYVDRADWDAAQVEPTWSIVCPPCFTQLHEQHTGKRTTWRLTADT